MSGILGVRGQAFLGSEVRHSWVRGKAYWGSKVRHSGGQRSGIYINTTDDVITSWQTIIIHKPVMNWSFEILVKFFRLT